MRIELPLLHPIQLRIATHPGRFKVVACGRRWGKTRLAVALALAIALEGRRVWWVGPVYQTASIAFRVLKALTRQIPGVRVKTAERVIYLPGGGEIWIKSADRPDNLRGEGLDYVVLDEADYQPEAVWSQVLRPALADRKGGALFISTPRQDDGWFHRAYKRGFTEEGNQKGWFSWSYESSTNPFLDPQELEDAKDDMSLLEFQREFLALFVAAPGAVYPTYRSEVHLGDYPLLERHPVYLGVDFNVDQYAERPMSATALQYVDDFFRVVGEVAEPGTTEQHAERLRVWCYERGLWVGESFEQGKPDPARVVVVPDASGAHVQQAQGFTNHEIFRRAGFRLDGPRLNPYVADRDNAVLAYLENARGLRRFGVDRSCRKTSDSFSRLVHQGRKRSPYSHLTDCVGYVIWKLAPLRRRLATPVAGNSRIGVRSGSSTGGLPRL